MKVKCIESDPLFYIEGVVYEVQRQYIANVKDRGVHKTQILIKHGLSKTVDTIDINEKTCDFVWHEGDK